MSSVWNEAENTVPTIAIRCLPKLRNRLPVGAEEISRPKVHWPGPGDVPILDAEPPKLAGLAGAVPSNC